MSEKRQASTSFGSTQVVKRQRSDANMSNGSAVAVSNGTGQNGSLIRADSAPVMELTGHSGEVFAARFDQTGRSIASGSMDRSILLWETHGECRNVGVMSGHKGAVMDLHWSRDSRTLFTASADATVASWDTETGQRLRRHQGHDEVINSLDVSKRGVEVLVSASDDGTISLWDPRQKQAIEYFETDFPVCAVALAEAGNEIYSGGIDNEIKTWDLRKKAVVYSMKGHTDTVTSLQLSSDSQILLSNSHDSTVRTWDVKPFAPENRHKMTFDGAPTGIENNLLKASWDSAGRRIVAGSGDRTAVIWDAMTGKLLSKLPGHKGAVNDVRFSPGESNTILSASSDHNLMLGELTV
ncbi:MAG: hypothetical protein M1828_004860 [Chrysothrix sp. TS-e1954]|nr:MAG: hypothetical protein M1828_004860 [Chrysothrix sp. TS-e1954]